MGIADAEGAVGPPNLALFAECFGLQLVNGFPPEHFDFCWLVLSVDLVVIGGSYLPE